MSEQKNSTHEGFTTEERAAMKERAKEIKSARGGKKDPEAEVLAKIAELLQPDRGLAERVHALVRAAAPELTPKLWYGMPTYAKDGKNVVFFQPAAKFDARYSTLGFEAAAALDDGSMWPTSYALTTLTADDEKRITALVKKAVS